MGRCVPIYECEYLFDILKSNTLTQQSISFLRLSQCDAEMAENTTPHVCCARNDDNLTSQSHNVNKTQLTALSAIFMDTKTMNEQREERQFDDSIFSRKIFMKILPDRSVCGKETIVNRIYSGQVKYAVYMNVTNLINNF